MGVWTDYFGETIVTKDGEKPTEEVLGSKKVVGIYFSALWCPPCRAFTPMLSVMYEEMVEAYPDFEIVFASSDHDVEGFNTYYEEMTFKAMPYANREGHQALGRKFGVSGIPTLLFLNDKGEVINSEGRKLVKDCNGDVDELWESLQ